MTGSKRSAMAMLSDTIPVFDNLMVHNLSVIQEVLGFVGYKGFLFVANVSKNWHESWGSREKKTDDDEVCQSSSRIRWAIVCGYPERRKYQLVKCVSHHGLLDELKILLWSTPVEGRSGAVCNGAARGGHLDILEWARVNNYPLRDETCRQAALGGNLEVLQWVETHGAEYTDEMCHAAAKGGSVDVLKWVLNKGVEWDGYCLYAAAALRNFEILKYAQKEKLPWYIQDVGETIWGDLPWSYMQLDVDDIETMEICIDHGHDYCEIFGDWAGICDNLDALKMCEKKGVDWRCFWITLQAARRGHLELLKWARQHGLEWSETCAEECESALENGHLELLKWLVASDYPYKVRCPDLCYKIASEGEFDLLRWAREQGVPWNAETCSAVVEWGDLEMLKWCVENGAPWNREKCRSIARRSDEEEIVRWIDEFV